MALVFGLSAHVLKMHVRALFPCHVGLAIRGQGIFAGLNAFGCGVAASASLVNGLFCVGEDYGMLSSLRALSSS